MWVKVRTNGPLAEKCVFRSPDNGRFPGGSLSPSPDMPRMGIRVRLARALRLANNGGCFEHALKCEEFQIVIPNLCEQC